MKITQNIYSWFPCMSEQSLLVFTWYSKCWRRKEEVRRQSLPEGFHTLGVDIIINPDFKRCSSVLVSEGHRDQSLSPVISVPDNDLFISYTDRVYMSVQSVSYTDRVEGDFHFSPAQALTVMMKVSVSQFQSSPRCRILSPSKISFSSNPNWSYLSQCKYSIELFL